MFKRKLTIALGAAALAAGIAACGSSSGGATNAANASSSSNLPTVTMMVGGIDKQIYLPYQLAQNLGYFKKYGVNMQLSTEQTGGVGAETAMASSQVDLAGAWYEGQGRHQPRPAVRRSGRARDVHQELRRHQPGAVEGQDSRCD